MLASGAISEHDGLEMFGSVITDRLWHGRRVLELGERASKRVA